MKDQQVRNTLGRMIDLGMVEIISEKYGTRDVGKYVLTTKGKRLVSALKKFLQELEESIT